MFLHCFLASNMAASESEVISIPKPFYVAYFWLVFCLFVCFPFLGLMLVFIPDCLIYLDEVPCFGSVFINCVGIGWDVSIWKLMFSDSRECSLIIHWVLPPLWFLCSLFLEQVWFRCWISWSNLIILGLFFFCLPLFSTLSFSL